MLCARRGHQTPLRAVRRGGRGHGPAGSAAVAAGKPYRGEGVVVGAGEALRNHVRAHRDGVPQLLVRITFITSCFAVFPRCGCSCLAGCWRALARPEATSWSTGGCLRVGDGS
jgi:hypothetical protein